MFHAPSEGASGQGPTNDAIRIVSPVAWRQTPARAVHLTRGEAVRVEGLAYDPRGVRAIEIDGVRASVRPEPGVPNTVRFVGYAAPDSIDRATTIAVHSLGGSTRTRRYPFAVSEEDRGLGPTEESTRRRPRGARWAVVIGISDYPDPDIPDLRYANADARAFYDFLMSDRSGGGFTRETTQLLVDSAATYARVRWALRTFLAKATGNDIVVIYFAGHGMPNPDRLDELYLAPYDAKSSAIASTGIPMSDVDDATRRIYAHDVLVIVDACHAAGVGGTVGRRAATIPNEIHRAFLERLETSTGGLVVFTASQRMQLSKEGPQWGGHGVFTYFILRALEGAADEDGNGIVTLGEMLEWVRASVRRETNETQTPAISLTSFDPSWPLSIVSPEARTAASHSTGRDSVVSPARPAASQPSAAAAPLPNEVGPRRSANLAAWTLAMASGVLAIVAAIVAYRRRRNATDGGAPAPALPVGSADTPAPQPTAVSRVATDERGDSLPAAHARDGSLIARLADRYATERELTRGRVTSTYLARDLRLNRPVVVKMVHHDQPITDKDTLRFRREIRILSTLNHPGIIPIHDADVEGASTYAVMAHAPGESVRARLERERRLSVEDAVRIAAEVAEALDYAHRRGIVHRAIRPECLILSGGRALITDFGVARPIGSGVGEVTTVGSAPQGPPEYLSPEQMLAGFEADGRADIYSLGVVLFEMLTGAVPFRVADGSLDRTAKYSGPPAAPSTLRKDIPAWLDAVITRALTPYPEHRFGSAIEFATALRSHGK